MEKTRRSNWLERYAGRLARAIVVVCVFGYTSAAAAQPWPEARDQAMQVRAAGSPQQAYAIASAGAPRTVRELADKDFLLGFLALRTLGRADVALEHFQSMALDTSQLDSVKRDPMRAQAGYWLGRALTALNRTKEANEFYAASAVYRNTFYGLLSASMIQLTDHEQALRSVAAAYPNQEFAWHDPRMPKELVLAVVRTESDFKQSTVSSAGAVGEMQVMRDVARDVAKRTGIAVDMAAVRSNPDYNIAVGTRFFGDLISKYDGSILLAAAAYNAGPAKADEWIQRFGNPHSGTIEPVDWIELIPFWETRDYVKKIIATYITYMAVHKG